MTYVQILVLSKISFNLQKDQAEDTQFWAESKHKLFLLKKETNLSPQFWVDPLNLYLGGSYAQHITTGGHPDLWTVWRFCPLFFEIRIQAHETDFSLQNGALQFMF